MQSARLHVLVTQLLDFFCQVLRHSFLNNLHKYLPVRKSIDFPFPNFFFWLFLAISFPGLSGNLSLLSIVKIGIYFFTAFAVGEILLGSFSNKSEIPNLFKGGIYIFFGSISLSIFALLTKDHMFIYVLAFFFIIYFFYSHKISFSFDFKELLVLSPLLVLTFNPIEYTFATNTSFVAFGDDYYYYTAIVESLKAHYSLTDAIYHKGLPINYLIIPYLAPGQLASFAGISAKISMWGVFFKILPFFSFGLLSYVVVILQQKIFISKSDYTNFYLKQFLVIMMLLFLAPINLMAFKTFDLTKSLLLGEGYLLPMGSAGYVTALILTSVALLLIFSEGNWGWYKRILFVCTLALIAGSKIAFWVPLLTFIGIFSFFNYFRNNKEPFISLLIAIPVCYFVYSTLTGGVDAMGAFSLTTRGYYYNLFLSLATKYKLSSLPLELRVLFMFFVSVFLWVGCKILIFAYALIKNQKSNHSGVLIFWSLVGCLLISIIPGFILEVSALDENGKFLYDLSFDMPQFVRGAIFLFSLFAYASVLQLLHKYRNQKLNLPFLFFIIIWMITIIPAFINNTFMKPFQRDPTWYVEIIREFDSVKPKMMAMKGDAYFSGQELSANGINPWYCTGTRLDGDGYTMSQKAYKRNINFQQLYDSSITLNVKKSIIDQINVEGVDYLIATPNNIDQIKALENQKLVSSVPGFKWFFSVKKDL